jgi:hypothetical protein
LGDLSTPDSVQKLQTALHAKAKAEPGYRFYALYDKISREDILAHAYAQCRSNRGAPGVDRQDFEAGEAYGVERWLGELALALRQETYRPDPIRRVYIPKANGKLRPLGISTLRDRVCMTAAMLVLEPIFEADLPSELYAYRPGRNAQQAVVEVEELLFRGHPEVVDADLADYFGSIPHAELLKSVARRIVDRRVLHLIKMWLDCPVEETDDRGRKTHTTEARDQRLCGAQRHHGGRKEIEPRRHARAAKQQEFKEARLQREGGEGLVQQQRALNRSRYPRQFAPVGAELERHNDPGDDAEPERHAENLQPEFENHSVGGSWSHSSSSSSSATILRFVTS